MLNKYNFLNHDSTGNNFYLPSTGGGCFRGRDAFLRQQVSLYQSLQVKGQWDVSFLAVDSNLPSVNITAQKNIVLSNVFYHNNFTALSND